MTSDWLLGGETLIWLIAIGLIAVTQEKRRTGGVGLVLAYTISLWLIHWPGAAIYLLPWYSNLSPTLVESGFRQSAYAVLAFAVGSVVLGSAIIRLLPTDARPEAPPRLPPARLEIVYLVWGLVSYVVLIPLVGQTPTARAIVVAGWSVLVTGLGLRCWREWSQERPLAVLGALVLAGCLPFVTIVSQGYLGYGTVALVAVLSFVKTFRVWPRWSFLAAGLLFAYLGLSFYGSYIRDRSEIREAVWGGDSLTERIDRVYLTVRNLEWFDPYDNIHLERIDERLNQNALVGAAIDYLESGATDFATGETLWQAATALVPRAIWPNKPVVAGSADLVSRYTGLSFDEDTSVGVGQIMEFYINFGTIGVVLGFLALGGLITVVDSMARRRLAAGNWQGFALWYVPGLSLLQAGGSLVDVVGSGGAALINVLLVNHVLLRLAGVGKVNTGGHPVDPSGSRLPRAGKPRGRSNVGHRS
jgi:hypothetical protein